MGMNIRNSPIEWNPLRKRYEFEGTTDVNGKPLCWMIGNQITSATVLNEVGDTPGIGSKYFSSGGKEYIKTADNGISSDWELVSHSNGILGDGSLGTVLRCSRIAVNDGTGANTIECRLYNVWNGDSTENVDNIAKDNVYYGGFSLNAPGEVLSISPTILSGNPIFGIGWITMNDTSDLGLSCGIGISTGGGGEKYLTIEIPTFTGGLSFYDISALADLGSFQIKILYITDA